MTMPIQMLPNSTASLLGSSNVLVSPVSFVKELLENALDAGATSVTVETSANTLDVVQVRDNGCGIDPEDRDMLCKHFCTSKITQFSDIETLVPGRFLGFRGEALASAREMCARLIVTTRTDQEETAVSMTYTKTGEPSKFPASHPRGTTVRAEKLFCDMPVRSQTHSQPAAVVKCFGQIKALLQSYAFARPSVRLALKVLNSNASKNNWVHSPTADANIRDVALNVTGKACLNQCVLITDSYNGFVLEALLPSASFDSSHINGKGPFISIDSRPVKSTRGTLKKCVTFYRERLASLSASSGDLRNPFICLNISCPPRSYDVNIESAKDDVAFANEDDLLAMIHRLMEKAYSERDEVLSNLEIPNVRVTSSAGNSGGTPSEKDSISPVSMVDPAPLSKNSVWMNGGQSVTDINCDTMLEDALQDACNDPQYEFKGFSDSVSEDTDILDVTTSNPWTIARLTATRSKERLDLDTSELFLDPQKENPRSIFGAGTGCNEMNANEATQELWTALPTPANSSPTKGVANWPSTVQRSDTGATTFDVQDPWGRSDEKHEYQLKFASPSSTHESRSDSCEVADSDESFPKSKNRKRFAHVRRNQPIQHVIKTGQASQRPDTVFDATDTITREPLSRPEMIAPLIPRGTKSTLNRSYVDSQRRVPEVLKQPTVSLRNDDTDIRKYLSCQSTEKMQSLGEFELLPSAAQSGMRRDNRAAPQQAQDLFTLPIDEEQDFSDNDSLPPPIERPIPTVDNGALATRMSIDIDVLKAVKRVQIFEQHILAVEDQPHPLATRPSAGTFQLWSNQLVRLLSIAFSSSATVDHTVYRDRCQQLCALLSDAFDIHLAIADGLDSSSVSSVGSEKASSRLTEETTVME